jgi:murein DD-endopeptidase MepM/ murein hydrolase activator NlpD
MAEWNRTHPYESTSWIPGSTVTGPFGEKVKRLRIGSGEYVSYRHTGTDILGPNDDVVSAGFYNVEKVLGSHKVVLRRVGTDIRTTLAHLSTTANLRVGQTLEPGELIGSIAETYPASWKHLHVEEWTRIGANSVFLDPSKHLPAPEGTSFYWKRERLIRRSPFEPLEYEVLVDNPFIAPDR